ncbi:hypothetical protein HZH68_007943 [Vespula germanica]|uniref:Uncharacterized protein n=1 Tax=Vespula germanica TaxID=30212 RepID=A0A834K3I3_VESGE|nr:hypothetical protein HZH68_007943 [Vespula germanica]
MPNVCQIIAGCRACRLGFNNRVDKEPKKIEEEAECSASPARTRGGGRPDWILLLFEILVRKRSPHHGHINQPWLPRIEDRGCTPFVVIPRGLLHALSMPLFGPQVLQWFLPVRNLQPGGRRVPHFMACQQNDY